MSTGLEITKFSGKFMFLTMYQLWDNSWSWKHEFSWGKVRFPTCTKDSRKFYEINRWTDRAKAFHIPHVIPHVRFYITAATTSAGQNTNRMHRLLFDTSTSWSSIKFTLSKNNCEREYWLCRDYKWPRRGRNARSGDLSTYFIDRKNVLWTDFLPHFKTCYIRQYKQ